jgi:hypothetical protein
VGRTVKKEKEEDRRKAVRLQEERKTQKYKHKVYDENDDA